MSRCQFGRLAMLISRPVGVFLGTLLGASVSLLAAAAWLRPARPVLAAGGGTAPGAFVSVDRHRRFGTVPAGLVLVHDFTVRNTAPGPVRLELGPASCSCTTVELEDEAVAAGGRTTVRVR